MSATTTVGNYEVANDPLWDPEMERWYIHVGIGTKKGIEIDYTVRGRTPEGTAKKAKRLAEIMTIWKAPKQWITFDGSYDKEFYDVMLISGKIVENCYPNAGDFTVLRENAGYHASTEIKGSQVSKIRLSNFNPFKEQ